MPRLETVTTPPTLGAGRRYSYSFPPLGQTANNTLPTADALMPRPGGVPSTSHWGYFPTGAPPAPLGTTTYNGRIAWQITSSTGTGVQLSPSNTGTLPTTTPFAIEKIPGASLQGVDDFWCWSIAALFAFDTIPGAVTGDCGLGVGVATRCGIRRPAAALAGMEIGPTGPGTVGVVVRQADGGAITFAQNITPPSDMTDFNKYEIRLIGPTVAAEAKAQFRINDVTLLELPWGAGTVLPDLVETTGLGFNPGIINVEAVPGSTTRMYFPPFGLTVCAGPSEDALP